MPVDLDCPYTFAMELGVLPAMEHAEGQAPAAFTPLHHEDITADLADPVEEAFVGGVLADRIDPGSGSVAVTVQPVWNVEPVVDRIRIVVNPNGSPGAYAAEFKEGRWTRRLSATLRRLRTEKVLGEEEKVYARLVALHDPSNASHAIALPPLQAPEITDQTLADVGVRALGAGELDPDRPILVNRRAVDEILERTVAAGTSEIGGGMLGKIVRLPEPVAGARSRVVTVLSAGVPDVRHEGAPGRLSFSPDALIDAACMADLRGLGESVLTVYHSHGWGTGCDECNHNAACVLPSVGLVSGDDYEVLESLFPSKATLMPIAGRKLGAPGKRPVLEIHAWSGGAMRPTCWRTYSD